MGYHGTNGTYGTYGTVGTVPVPHGPRVGDARAARRLEASGSHSVLTAAAGAR